MNARSVIVFLPIVSFPSLSVFPRQFSLYFHSTLLSFPHRYWRSLTVLLMAEFWIGTMQVFMWIDSVTWYHTAYQNVSADRYCNLLSLFAHVLTEIIYVFVLCVICKRATGVCIVRHSLPTSKVLTDLSKQTARPLRVIFPSLSKRIRSISPQHTYILLMSPELPQKRFTPKVTQLYLCLHLPLGTLLQFLNNKFILSTQEGHQ